MSRGLPRSVRDELPLQLYALKFHDGWRLYYRLGDAKACVTSNNNYCDSDEIYYLDIAQDAWKLYREFDDAPKA